tara:strand:- start:1261 stop:2028 length:768 start_codon:yes stop_codon:yes gene_type:complete
VKITVLARPGSSTAILLNWLVREGYSDLEVILEASPKRSHQIRQRARRLGLRHALGQALFVAVAVPFLRRQVAERRRALLTEYNLDDQMPLLKPTLAVETINDPVVAARLKQTPPRVVLVNGTRIIRVPVLMATSSPFINTHVGITPDYRGVHGGYWALWNNEPEKFGVTLHLVDEGVDTGKILAQAVARPTRNDNFASYALLQQIAAFSKLKKLLETIERDEPLTPSISDGGAGKQWFHPTLLQYARGRLRGVR